MLLNDLQEEVERNVRRKEEVGRENWQYHMSRKTRRSNLIQVRERGVQ